MRAGASEPGKKAQDVLRDWLMLVDFPGRHARGFMRVNTKSCLLIICREKWRGGGIA